MPNPSNERRLFERLDLLFAELARVNATLVASLRGEDLSKWPLASSVLASPRVCCLSQSGHCLAESYHLRKYPLCSIDQHPG